MPYNPCGYVVDITRRAHDEPCKFFSDSDRVDVVSFYEAAPEAPAFPGWCLIYPAQNDPVEWPNDKIGTLNRRPFKTTLAKAPKGLLYDHYCGTKDQHANGAKYEPDKPPQPIGADGLPRCCTPPPRIGGAGGVAGRALFRVYRPLVVTSGAGASGKALYSVSIRNDATAGGLVIGGAAGDVFRGVDPTAGGLLLGGAAGDVFEPGDHGSCSTALDLGTGGPFTLNFPPGPAEQWVRWNPPLVGVAWHIETGLPGFGGITVVPYQGTTCGALGEKIVLVSSLVCTSFFLNELKPAFLKLVTDFGSSVTQSFVVDAGNCGH